MTSWTDDELARIGGADELRIAPRTAGGELARKTTIWVVREGDDLYVRSYRGHNGAWWRAAEESKAGQVEAGGVTKDVTFTDVTDTDLNDRLDAAYRDKYRSYSSTYVDPMVAEPARSATLRLIPA
ncbi:DUF2255 family protein [Actinacidiphila guanduensis]|jgi:hypothetical protein|uniref:DUF2255 family protein n=1 Tax=Actinacidiphila guanduensis TaxID=310781 RepID=A0A1G9V6T8_9ACTN|nr:DUF2255 family protein [Actinacidiphila guanduensis]SDM67871.1 hypothetical protein SAMN05216259_101153 [Actinacidiphila guanduensis]